MLETINGIPTHPLFVHFVVVLLPLSAIGMIALVLVSRFRGRIQFGFIGGALVFSTVMAYVAKDSGGKLNQQIRVSAEHHEWGERVLLFSVALLLASAIWMWMVETRRKSVITKLLAIGVVALSLGAIAATILAGDSGAKSVWDKQLAESSTQDRSSNSTTSKTSTTNTVTSRDTVASTGTDSTTNMYSLNDVAAHDSPEDCWSVVSNNVYDLTAWISQHPGGAGNIERTCGIDATDDFIGEHDGQRQPERELANFRIGELSS